MSPGLKRAREPYRIKNAIMGLSLGAFAVAVWAYSINAVRQDVFDDVDEEARAMSASTSTPETISNLEVGAHINPEAAGSQTVSPVLITNSVILKEVARTETSKRGVLHHLDKRFPWLLDQERKTLVWGAPPVDNFGKMWKS
jgi:cytochrome c oxidase assembly factor 3